MWVDHQLQRNGREQFDGMDLLRTIASLMIVVYHAHSIALKHVHTNVSSFIAAPLWWYSCIELFFVMSGFLMVHMSRTLYGRSGGVREFIIRRMVRTPPLYYVFTTIIFLIFLVVPTIQDSPATFYRYLVSLLFYPSTTPPIIAIGWTLNYEVFFYAITAVSIFLAYPFGPLGALLVVSSFATVGLVFPGLPAPFSLWTDPLMFNFSAGMIVALVYYRNICIPQSALLFLGFAATVILFLPSMFLSAINDVPRLLFFTPGMTLWLAFFTLRSSPYRITFGERQIRSFAARTYTLYLCHIIALKLTEKAYFKIFSSSLSVYMYIIVGTVLSVLMAYALFPIIEEPLGRLLRSAFLRRKERLITV